MGQKQAALDLDVVVKYDTATSAKVVPGRFAAKIAEQVKQMAGRDVIEVNIHVIDIKLPEDTNKG